MDVNAVEARRGALKRSPCRKQGKELAASHTIRCYK
jgi:hypothetical protein